MKKQSNLNDFYKDWIRPFLIHPFKTSMIVGGFTLAFGHVTYANDRNKSKDKTYIISNDPNISTHADGATLTTNAHLYFSGEEGSTDLDDLLHLSSKSNNLEYKVKSDPKGYLKRVIGNNENQASTKRLARYFLNSGRFVEDTVSVSSLQSAVDDHVIEGKEIRDVKPGLYVLNALTMPYNTKNGASLIIYLDVKNGENPNTDASQMAPTLFSNPVLSDSVSGDKYSISDLKISAGRLFDTNIYNGFFLETAFNVGNGFYVGPGIGYRVGDDSQHAYGEGETYFGRTSFWEETSSDKFINWDVYANLSKRLDLGKDFSISPTLKLGYSNRTFSENNRYTSGRVDSLGNQSDVFTNSEGRAEKEGQMLFGLGSGFDYKHVGICAGMIFSEATPNYYIGANISFGGK